LLRASGHHEKADYKLAGVTDPSNPTGVPHGAALLAFVDAALGRDPGALATARAAVIQAVGQAGMLDAAAVIGGFDGITRIADATGIPLEPAKAEAAADFIAELGIDRYKAWEAGAG
jgi:hypothetical protein